MSVGCCSDEFVWHQETRTHRANHTGMSHCSKKCLVSRNEERETENMGATDLDVRVNLQFSSPSARVFVFNLC